MDDRLVAAVFIEEGAGLEARLGPEVPEGVHGDPDERDALLVSVVTNVTGFCWREAGRSSRAASTDRRTRSTVGALSIKI